MSRKSKRLWIVAVGSDGKVDPIWSSVRVSRSECKDDFCAVNGDDWPTFRAYGMRLTAILASILPYKHGPPPALTGEDREHG